MAEPKKRGGCKKPAHLAGPVSVEQRIWTAIRARRDAGKTITRADVEFDSGQKANAVRSYFIRLVAGGYLKGRRALPRSATCSHFSWQTYDLARDVGLQAPRLASDGSELQLSARERMWQSLRILKATSALDLQLTVSAAGGKPLPYLTAKTYLLKLKRAGYVVVEQRGRSGQGKAGSRFRLLPSMNTGPRSPIEQKTGAFFDPNLNRTVWRPRKK